MGVRALGWNGSRSSEATFDELVEAVRDDVNPTTSRDELYLRMMRGVRVLKAKNAERELNLLREELR